jgi:hypothetical protein
MLVWNLKLIQSWVSDIVMKLCNMFGALIVEIYFYFIFSLHSGVETLTIRHSLILVKIKLMMLQMSMRQNLAIYKLGYKLNIWER